MTEVATKRSFVHDRFVPGVWIVATTVIIIALAWQWSWVGLLVVAVVAGAELGRMVAQICSHWKLSVHVPITVEWLLLLQWPPVLTYVHYQAGWKLMGLVVFTVFVSDVLAFFGGQQYGRHKLAVRISKGKSWEGVGFGLVGGLVTAFAFRSLFDVGITVSKLLLVTVAMVLVGIVGDLNESWIKRLAGEKDSSRLLRDHGGMLDRIDSLLTASLLVAVLVYTGVL